MEAWARSRREQDDERSWRVYLLNNERDEAVAQRDSLREQVRKLGELEQRWRSHSFIKPSSHEYEWEVATHACADELRAILSTQDTPTEVTR